MSKDGAANVLIIGAGVMGLALAYNLAARGQKRSSSWTRTTWPGAPPAGTGAASASNGRPR